MPSKAYACATNALKSSSKRRFAHLVGIEQLLLVEQLQSVLVIVIVIIVQQLQPANRGVRWQQQQR